MSLNIATSGLQAINQQLGSISNNIANAGTYGFKSTRANFAAAYAGTQPAGAMLASNTQSIGVNGGVANTGRTMDAAINGRGMFVLRDSAGQDSYSRVGIFSKNANDLLVDAAGRRVQGFQLTPPSTTPGPLGDITIPTAMQRAKASTRVNFVANLSPDWPVPTAAWVAPNAAAVPPVVADPNSYNWSQSTVYYDSLGRQHTLTQYFIATGTNNVTLRVALDGTQPTGFLATLGFDTSGRLATLNGSSTVSWNLTATPPRASLLVMLVDYTGMTMQSGAVTTSKNAPDGNAAGTFTGVTLGTDGTVSASYSNGQKQAVAQLALATFPNDDGLVAVDNTSWTANAASGTPNLSPPGVGIAGSLSIASLEQSNVDITAELVGLMTAQRNYQANSKVISTENQTMQALLQAI